MAAEERGAEDALLSCGGKLSFDPPTEEKSFDEYLSDPSHPVPFVGYTTVQMNTAPASLGLIAGNRSLPLEFARQARAAGVKRLVAVAFENETDPALAQLVDEIVWLKVGQLSKMISAFTDRGIKQCVMVGQIAPKNLFDLRPDLRAMGLLLRLKEKNAHTIFGAIADELKKDGVELIEATPWLKPLMPQTGFQLGPKLSDEQKADVEFGFRIAKEISRLEIGQTVRREKRRGAGRRGF